MNPERPARGHRHKARTGDRTRNTRGYRVTANGHPVYRGPDRAAARRAYRAAVADGHRAEWREHTGHGTWRTIRHHDPRDVDRAAQDARDSRIRAHLAARAQATADALDTQRALTRKAIQRLMTPPAHVRTDRRARHTAGSR